MSKTLYISLILGLFLFAGGCESVIFDDLSECAQGVNFGFYRQTPCESGPSYPDEIKQVRVFAFDKENLLVAEYNAEDINISADYLLETSFYRIGTFTFVAWGGTDLSAYDFSSFEKEKTTKEQMFVSLQRQSDELSSKPKPLYFGVSSPLTIEDRSEIGSIFDLVTFNMQKLTNRVHFTIHGLPKTENYSVIITDDNGVYDFNGNIADDSRFNYITAVSRDGDMLKADFVLMKLSEGRDTRLTIKNETTGKIIYTVNLVDDLIMYKGDSGEPPYSLDCDHQFNVVIVFDSIPENQDTYMLLKVVINEWNVVTRPVILG